MMTRPIPFVLAATAHGSMILLHNDVVMQTPTTGYGVGFQLLNRGVFDPDEGDVALQLINSRLKNYGKGVVVIDCGANIGVFSVEWGKYLHGLGHVYAFEAQEKIFYALAGNLAINNCLNVTARHAAVGAAAGVMDIPEPNYYTSGSFGSFELKERPNTENIGQPIDYEKPTMTIPVVPIDALSLPRLDFMKIDVEGMEMDVLEGAAETIQRCKPQLFIEVLKTDEDLIAAKLAPWGYTRKYPIGLNVLFLHDSDPLQVKKEEEKKA